MQEQQHHDATAALCGQHASALEAAAAKSAQQAAKHAEILEQQHQQLVAAMGSMDRAAQQDQQQQQADFDSELSSMRQLHEQSLTELQAQHEAVLRDLQGELQQASEACMTDRQQAHDDAIQKLEGQLQDLQEQLQTDEAEHQARMEAVLKVQKVCFFHRQQSEHDTQVLYSPVSRATTVLCHKQGRVLQYLHLFKYHGVAVMSASATNDFIGMVSCSTSALIAMSLLLTLHMLAQSSVTVSIRAWMLATSGAISA